MRRKGIDKEETRKNICEAVSRGFRKHGYAGVGVDGLAKAAGVTAGAFYAHLGSKASAFNLALDLGLEEVIEGVPRYQKEHGVRWIEAFSEYYLSEAHWANVEVGCAMASLTPEVARFDSQARDHYEQKMTEIVGLIADGLAGGTDEKRQSRAWAFLSILIGGLNIARAVGSSDTARIIRNSIGPSAIEAAGEAKGPD